MLVQGLRQFRRSGILMILFLASVRCAEATVIFDNFDAGGGFHPQNYLGAAYAESSFVSVGAERMAVQFTVAGGDFSLTSITLPIGFQGDASGSFLRVRLTSDNGGAPGATLEVLSENAGIWPTLVSPFTTTTTVISAAHPTLSDGARFWIVTEPTSMPPSGTSYTYEWFDNTSENTVPVWQQQKPGGLPADPWTGFSGPGAVAFRVEGTLGSAAVGGPQASGLRLELGLPWPNPAAGSMKIALRLAVPSLVRSEVFDLTGRQVLSLLSDQELSTGAHLLTWDGREVSGHRVAAGVYMVRVSTGAVTAVRRVTLLK